MRWSTHAAAGLPLLVVVKRTSKYTDVYISKSRLCVMSLIVTTCRRFPRGCSPRGQHLNIPPCLRLRKAIDWSRETLLTQYLVRLWRSCSRNYPQRHCFLPPFSFSLCLYLLWKFADKTMYVPVILWPFERPQSVFLFVKACLWSRRGFYDCAWWTQKKGKKNNSSHVIITSSCDDGRREKRADGWTVAWCRGRQDINRRRRRRRVCFKCGHRPTR